MHDPANGRFALASGRDVHLTHLLLTLTYAGVLEGSPATASEFIRTRLADDVALALGMRMPVVILDNSEVALPSYRWAAAFESRRGVRTNDPDYNSHLALCWFSDTIPPDLHGTVVAALSQVDWEAHAQDYDIMP